MIRPHLFRFAAQLLVLLLALPALAQSLTTAQLTTLKNAINADPALAAIPNTPDGAQAVADALNAIRSPDFIAWRTSVSREEIYNATSAEATTWNWTTYRNQAATEQNAWVQMFMGDRANFAQPNLRAGVAAIFSGSAQANAQRDHVLAVAKRKATRFESIFAVGTGSVAVPATMAVEGQLTYQVVQAARSLP